ncbi:MAG TPA: glycosyl hydrolase family 18 protein [Aequorivita sp.]|nr:glycosyl hydrolase family 18 protein [Aequorivita sp.]
MSKSVKVALERHNSDGIDLDWEYPVVAGHPGHPYKPADRENFTALVEELRETLGDDYYISFAAGAFDAFLEKSIEWEKVMPLLDKVNLMTYDMVNGGSPLTGHPTPLYSTTEQSLSANNAIQFLNNLGVPSEKIVIGSAFYARVWEEVGNTSNGLYQTGRFKEAVLYKDLDAFMDTNSGFTTYWDSTAKATYSYNAQKGLFATYDDFSLHCPKNQLCNGK